MMPEKKYSAAPFGATASLSSDLFNIRYITDNDGRGIATIRIPPGMDQDEALANAALFKAAPDLLVSLDMCLNFLADMNGSEWIKSSDCGSVDMKQRAHALQAIALKATSRARGVK